MSRLPYWAKWIAQIAGTSYSVAKESQQGGAILLYLELVVDILSYVKQKWCICLNSLSLY